MSGYVPTNWQDVPSAATPITAAELNRMEAGIVAGNVPGSSIDYENAWAAGTAYLPGDIVTHNGVTYMAVNPSTGVPPPSATAQGSIGTSLPASPVDGQEYTLVDSLTAPTYAWRFRYVAGISDAYKWVFIGGSPICPAADTASYVLTSAYQGPYGPTPAIPRAGIYDLRSISTVTSNAAGEYRFKFQSTAGVITGAREHYQDTQSGNARWIAELRDRVTLPTAGLLVGLMILAVPNVGNTAQRILEVTPVRVA